VLRIAGVGLTWTVALAAAVVAVLTMLHGGLGPVTLSSPIGFLRLDAGVSLLAVPFLALLALVSLAVGSWSIRRGSPAGIVAIGCFALAMFGVFVAQSVTAFFLAWEAMSLIAAFLVAAHHERRDVRRATLTYLIVAQAGALCVLAALCTLAVATGSTSFAGIAAGAKTLSAPARDAAFVLALLGFGSKAGLLPLHFWLPRAHPVAPANASAMLSGVMLKVAVYGLCLVTLVLAAPATLTWGVTLTLLGTVSAIVGVLYALVDHDLKRLLAYHSIENVGIITLALGVALIALAVGNGAVAGLALIAALFHTINHGLFKALLFLGAGVVADTQGTVDLERLGGLWGPLVWTAPFFLIGCAAISGLPPFNGFASEWLTFQSLIAALAPSATPVKFVLVAAIAGLALTGGLAAACFVKVFGVGFLGRSRRPVTQPAVAERFDAATFGLGFLAALCIVFGIVPMLAVAPLGSIAAATLGVAPLMLPALPVVPAAAAMLPFAGALFAVVLAAARGVRRVPTWTCGSPVTAASQYSATAFSKPLRTIFAFLLLPERRRAVESGASRWFPARIDYRTKSRYLIDESARRFAALTLRLTRRSRALQSGSLRLYLAYAMATLVVVVAIVR
jgi:hydrogenase-4 component B